MRDEPKPAQPGMLMDAKGMAGEIARIIDPLVFELTEALDDAEGEPVELRTNATKLRDERLDVALAKASAILALVLPQQTRGGWRLVPCEPTLEMQRAADCALPAWRKTLDRDEAMMRSYQAHDRKFVASATPAEKHAIRYRAMLAAAPPPPGGDKP